MPKLKFNWEIKFSDLIVVGSVIVTLATMYADQKNLRRDVDNHAIRLSEDSKRLEQLDANQAAISAILNERKGKL